MEVSEDIQCYARTTTGDRCSHKGQEWLLVRGGIAACLCHQHQDRYVQLAAQDVDLDHVSTSLGQTIRELREIRGWTQNETAKRAGVGHRIISRLESGNGATTLKPLCKIASAFGVKAWKLLKDADL